MQRWILCIMIAALLCGCGCRSLSGTSQAERLLVSITSSGQLAIGEDSVPPSKIARLLRKHGGDPNKTEILLNIPERASPEDLSPAVAAIRVSGYRHIILVRPRKASATTRAPTQKRP
ncbi:MAG: hypothetical protein ISS35_03335 [Kiritimatiellae bacterium]|nr:hypothetical protein [Kiritimatiellia bacterium]